MLWSNCKVEAMTTQTESSTRCKTHSWMPWATTRMCERSCQNSFTCLSCIWIWTRSILAKGRTSSWSMILHCLLGVSKTHTSSSWDSEKPLSATMWVRTFANGSITYLATSNLALTLKEASTHIQASPTKTESIWRKSVKLTLIWPSHTSYKCTIMDKLQQMWFNSGQKSTQPKSIKKRFSNIIWLRTNSPIWKYTGPSTRRRTSRIITKPPFSAKFSKEDCHRFKGRLSSRPSSSMKDWLLQQGLMAKWDFICGSTKRMIWTHLHPLLVERRRRSFMSMPLVQCCFRMISRWSRWTSPCSFWIEGKSSLVVDTGMARFRFHIRKKFSRIEVKIAVWQTNSQETIPSKAQQTQ